MSRKTKTTATKEEAKPALVPKLRFPEFREAEGWKPTPLDRCLDYLQPTPYLVADTKYSPAFKTPVLTAGKTFILGYTDEQHGIFSEGLPVIIFDDFTTATQFVDFPFKAKSSAMKILEAKNGAAIKFMYETLQTLAYEVGAHERHWISNFAPMLVPVPTPAEQQKIASCLSSVDELMAAQARKVDALKTHKKGLMQQLFPREGETQPHLRFPEFQNAGEWHQKSLGGLCRIRTGKKDANEGAADGAYPFFTCAEKHIYSHSYSFDAEAILIAGNANVGQTNYYKGKFEAYQRTYVLTDFGNIFVPYLYSVLSANLRPDLLAQVQTSAMSYIRLPMLEEYQINAPTSQAEQQRIADCLTSLDDLIAAQTQKHEALKTHKKGLMQQLFPSPEEPNS